MNERAHWDQIYGSKDASDVSWYQREPTTSLRMIREVAPEPTAAIIDVGGGASTLVDRLLDAGYTAVSVLDISTEALEQAKERLGRRAELVTWIEADVLGERSMTGTFDVWHDRAVFHFLTSESDRQRYVDQVRRSVRIGGYVSVATFASDGPTHCSGLEVVRYDAGDLHSQFGSDFRLLVSEREEHLTPSGAMQPFTYCMCRVSA
jgi:SAM-dependent methyltransferase